MVRYFNFDVVFAEVPDQVSLAINITGCPNRCPGCHSPHLWEDTGRVLDEGELSAMLDLYGGDVTCVCFMGGDASPGDIASLAAFVRRRHPELRIAWYSGRPRLPEGFDASLFDYVKLGPWVERLGPLSSPSTNQRMYEIHGDGSLEDITGRFRRKK